MTDTVDIEIQEIDNRGVYDVWFNDELICYRTSIPFFTAARVLLENKDISANAVLHMYRKGSPTLAMTGRVGIAAQRRVNHTHTGKGRFGRLQGTTRRQYLPRR